jgi:thiol-disulfide isomerase/thioredoxin
MRRRWASLVVGSVLALAGCRSGGEKRPDDDRPAGPDRPSDLTSRGKDRSIDPDSPAHWLDRPKPDWMHGRTPAAPSWNTPKDPGYDYKAETGGLLSGYVEDPDGRKLKNVYIAVREVGDTNPKDVGVLSTADGSFVVQGLKPNRNYMLSVTAADGGRKLFGVVYTKTPNPNVRLALLEGDMGGSPPAGKPAAGTPNPPAAPADDPLKRPPTNAVPPPGSLPEPNMGGVSGGRDAGLPSPKPLDRDAGVYPTGGYEVPPASGPLPDRNDLMTDKGAPPWRPPAANIPAPRTGTPVPSADNPKRSESRKGEHLPLVDSRGRPADLPKSKLVLVQFFTTASETCRRAVPPLNAVQARYAGRGLEVVGLVCDDEPLKARVMAADQFRRDQDVTYLLLTEPGKRPTEWLARYGVSDLPTAVLLDSTGAVLWQGNPMRTTDLMAVIDEQLPGR